jgi:hypothetical protein
VNYNFTGGLVDTELESLTIESFGNVSNIVVPYLGQSFTEALRDRFLSQSRLSLTDGAADIELSGNIVQYNVAPVAIEGDDRAGQNRLSIAVRVKFNNNVNPNDSWEQTFNSFQDFSSSQDLSSIERDLIDEINNQLTQDIFNKSIGKW